MTTPSHTELAAQAAARLKAELAGMYPRENIDLSDVRTVIAALESPERVQGEATVGEIYSHNCNSKGEVFAVVQFPGPFDPNNQWTWPAQGAKVYLTQPTAPAQDVHGQRNAQTLVDIGNAALRAGWNGVDMKAFVLARLATPSPQAEKQPLSLDEIQAWAVRRMSALGTEGVTDPVAFLEEGVRWGEAQHGIVTKEST